MECRVAMRPRGGLTPPTPQWSALGILDQRSYRWLRRRSRSRLSGSRRSLTGEGDLLAVEARLVADHGTSAALTLQAVAYGDARWFALNLKTQLPASAGGMSGHHRFA